jgi:5'-nucleotidase / UDP-sugar diphosphatase
VNHQTRFAISIACVLAGCLAGGCASHKKKHDEGTVPLDRSVTDVAPSKVRSAVPPDPSFVSAPPAASQPRFVPVDVPPLPIALPAASNDPIASTPAPAPIVTRTPGAAAGHSYRVQKGDTLFGIAKTHYGDGKRWQQIASANPGLTPGSLKAGAMIVVP